MLRAPISSSGLVAPPFAEFKQALQKYDPSREDLRIQKPLLQISKDKPMAATSLRLARVIIFDPTDALPLESRVLVVTSEKLTDSTDEELYFDLDIKGLLEKHNEVRKATRDKKASERAGKDVFLEPIRIRDLRMTVVSVDLK